MICRLLCWCSEGRLLSRLSLFSQTEHWNLWVVTVWCLAQVTFHVYREMGRGMLLRSALWPGSSPRSVFVMSFTCQVSSSLTKAVVQLVTRSSLVGRPLLSRVICPFCFVCSRVLDPEGRTWHAPKGVVRTFKWAFHFVVENDLELFKAFFDSPASISKVLGFSGVSQWLLCWDQTQDFECLGKYSTNWATL